MALVRVRALAAFSHHGYHYAAGDVLEVEPVQAILLHNRRLVSLTRELGAVTRPIPIQEKTHEAATVADALLTTIEDTRDEPHSDEGGSPETPVRRRRGRPRKADPNDAHD